MQETTDMEQAFHDDLHQYLISIHRVDERLPEAPDLEELWPKLAESYMPDAIKEYTDYPTVALGWMMFLGMAVAKYWDTDWEVYGKVEDLYKYLRDRIDFDHMDDYICTQVLLLDDDAHKRINAIVGECASRTDNRLRHLRLEPGTQAAFRGFVAALHQMYLMGVAMELNALGYHMTLLQ